MNGTPHTNGERGSVLVVALLLMLLLFVLGSAILSMSEVEGAISSNEEWSEGAFFAAEAAVQAGYDQLTDDRTTSGAAIPVTNLGDRYAYRSGTIEDGSAQPIPIIGSVVAEGYSIGTSTGYNSSGFVFDIYQINATGTGPRNAVREVEVQVEYGPVVP